MKKNEKQIELIKHTFTNKLVSILTHARSGGCRCPRRQGITFRKGTWSPKAIRKGIQQILAMDATRTMIISLTDDLMQQIK